MQNLSCLESLSVNVLIYLYKMKTFDLKIPFAMFLHYLQYFYIICRDLHFANLYEKYWWSWNYPILSSSKIPVSDFLCVPSDIAILILLRFFFCTLFRVSFN